MVAGGREGRLAGGGYSGPGGQRWLVRMVCCEWLPARYRWWLLRRLWWWPWGGNSGLRSVGCDE
eukprot:7800298-Prorocentrum_lima.AAC.1